MSYSIEQQKYKLYSDLLQKNPRNALYSHKLKKYKKMIERSRKQYTQNGGALPQNQYHQNKIGMSESGRTSKTVFNRTDNTTLPSHINELVERVNKLLGRSQMKNSQRGGGNDDDFELPELDTEKIHAEYAEMSARLRQITERNKNLTTKITEGVQKLRDTNTQQEREIARLNADLNKLREELAANNIEKDRLHEQIVELTKKNEQLIVAYNTARESFDSDLRRLQANIEAAEKELDDERRKTSPLREKVLSLEEDNKKLGDQINKLQGINDKLQGQTRATTQERSTLEKELSENQDYTKKKITENNKQIETLKKQQEQNMKTIEQYVVEDEQQKNTIRLLQGDLTRMKAEIEKYKILLAEHEEMKKLKEALEKDLETGNKSNQILEGRVNELTNSLDKKDEAIKGKEKALQAVTEQLAIVNKQLAENASANANWRETHGTNYRKMEDDNVRLNAENNAIKKELEDNKNRLENNKQQITELETQLEEKEADLTELRTQIETQKGSKKPQQTQIQGLQKDMHKLKEEKQRMGDELKRLRGNNEELTAKIAELERAKTANENTIAELKTNNRSLISQYEILDKDHKILQQGLDMLKEQRINVEIIRGLLSKLEKSYFVPLKNIDGRMESFNKRIEAEKAEKKTKREETLEGQLASYKDLRNTQTHIINDNEEIKTKLNEYLNKLNDYMKSMNIPKVIQEKQEIINEQRESIEQNTATISEKQRQIDAMENQIKNLKAEIDRKTIIINKLIAGIKAHNEGKNEVKLAIDDIDEIERKYNESSNRLLKDLNIE